MPTFEEQKKKFYQPVAKPAMNQRRPAPQESYSPDYQKSKYAQRDAGLTGRNSQPVFSAGGFKGDAAKARINTQRSRYERERREAADKTSNIAQRQQGDMAITKQVGQQRASRQRAGFVDALQRQRADFGQQNRMQQNRIDQQNQQQQALFGQQSAMQERGFGQQNQLEQTRQEEARRKSALDYRLGGGSVTGAASIDNGMPDYGNIQPIQQQNKVNTYRALELGEDPLTGDKRYGSFNSATNAFSPLTLGERLTPGQ